MAASQPDERVAKWAAMESQPKAPGAQPIRDLSQDFGLGRYMPLNPALGGERFVLPASVAESLLNRAGAMLNVHDNDSLVNYWRAREDSNHAMAEEQLQPEQLAEVRAWHAANPAPPPPEMLTDGPPGDSSTPPDLGEDDAVAKWKALSGGSQGGGGDRVAKWKAASKPAQPPPAAPPAA